METVNVPHNLLQDFCVAALQSRSVREDVLRHVVNSLVQTSLRGVDSHGIELLPHYLRAIDAGRINPCPNCGYQVTSAATGKLDADHTFGHAAGGEAMSRAIEMARSSGVGAVAVYNSTHFGAAAYFALQAAEQNMIGMSFTHSTPHMLTYGGVRPFFSTNPICFAAPCLEEPFCLDMATTLATWNRLRAYRANNQRIPLTWGVDADGKPVTDPEQVVSLLPIGEYKGFGLSMMVDVLCSLLTGMPFGSDVSQMFSEPISSKRKLGHFFIALDIARFTNVDEFRNRLQAMMYAVRNEPAKDPAVPVMVPGDPEKKAYAVRHEMGIPLSIEAHKVFWSIAHSIGFPWSQDA